MAKSEFLPVTDKTFQPGWIWESSAGSIVQIVSVEKHLGARSDYCSEYSIVYMHDDGTKNDKDGWSFQVRYSPYQYQT